MSFRKWIEQFNEDDSPIGDLARDIQHDKEFPDSEDYEELTDHLKNNGACSGAKNAFKEAYKIFSNR